MPLSTDHTAIDTGISRSCCPWGSLMRHASQVSVFLPQSQCGHLGSVMSQCRPLKMVQFFIIEFAHATCFPSVSFSASVPVWASWQCDVPVSPSLLQFFINESGTGTSFCMVLECNQNIITQVFVYEEFFNFYYDPNNAPSVESVAIRIT